MAIVVQKYGGSSVSDVEKLGKVADKIVATKQAGHDVVVVVSAMGKTTDQLLALAKQVDETPPRRELDMLLSTGERVSMALLSIAIQKRGADAISFTGSQSGIITNDRHFDARIISVRPHRIEDELSRGKIVIIAGYQGMSYKREITTLGRGGSDTTALAMAAALGAERAEIYSDVDGVYSADPRVVADARHLPTITYEEMQEMAEAGAKVLHAAAVEFARRAGIDIHARSTFAPGRETIVTGKAEGARAIVGMPAVAAIELDGNRAAEALEVLRSTGASSFDLAVDERGTKLYVATKDLPDWARSKRAIDALGGARIREGLGAASVVGHAFGRDPSLTLGCLEALANAQVVAERTTTTPLRLTAIVEGPRLDDAVRALHSSMHAPNAGTA
jgi:aspartate kinase